MLNIHLYVEHTFVFKSIQTNTKACVCMLNIHLHVNHTFVFKSIQTNTKAYVCMQRRSARVLNLNRWTNGPRSTSSREGCVVPMIALLMSFPILFIVRIKKRESLSEAFCCISLLCRVSQAPSCRHCGGAWSRTMLGPNFVRSIRAAPGAPRFVEAAFTGGLNPF